MSDKHLRTEDNQDNYHHNFDALCKMLNKLELPIPSLRPDSNHCCKRGCVPCVYDYYKKSMSNWLTLMQELVKDQKMLAASRKTAILYLYKAKFVCNI